VNPDFRDMLRMLSEEGAEFLLVGAYALASHGYARATGDLDISVWATRENSEWVWRAPERFEAPLLGLSVADLETSDIVFRIGVAPGGSTS
jgi:hypothetical protein